MHVSIYGLWLLPLTDIQSPGSCDNRGMTVHRTQGPGGDILPRVTQRDGGGMAVSHQ